MISDAHQHSSKQAQDHKADALLTTQACTLARLLARQAAAELCSEIGDKQKERADNANPQE
jgi:hypothetical protein